jgi:hypothetical protein
MDSGYISEGGAGDPYLGRGRGRGAEDGYTSEGGLEAYSRKMEQRLAYERQREEAESQHRKYLELTGRKSPRTAAKQEHRPLPAVLGRQGEVPAVYKVVGGRRNVQKADSGELTPLPPPCICVEFQPGMCCMNGSDQRGEEYGGGQWENCILRWAGRSAGVLTGQGV